MISQSNNIDIRENILRREGNLLDLLLFDQTTENNIIWATDSYEENGREFSSQEQIRPELVTGKYGKLIQPRSAKSLAEQHRRTKEKAEVFTPLRIVNQINKEVDSLGQSHIVGLSYWKKFIRENKLEITCGEAPFIVSRYDPTASTRKIIKLKKRVGFLDRKLQIVSKYCDEKAKWIFWAKEAFKASYGYEWQGDNVLLARENLLYTLIDYYKAKFKESPTLRVQERFAEIISWNIFQMDGLKYVVPMSCHQERIDVQGKYPLLGGELITHEERECEGCKFNQPNKHNGKYVKIKDWGKNKSVKFINLVFTASL